MCVKNTVWDWLRWFETIEDTLRWFEMIEDDLRWFEFIWDDLRWGGLHLLGCKCTMLSIVSFLNVFLNVFLSLMQ
jgi:hypothetical protein